MSDTHEIAATFDARASNYTKNDWHRLCAARLVELCQLRPGSFFSSRGRHTSFDGDWSSDVCSSDLDRIGEDRYFHAVCLCGEPRLGPGHPYLVRLPAVPVPHRVQKRAAFLSDCRLAPEAIGASVQDRKSVV